VGCDICVMWRGTLNPHSVRGMGSLAGVLTGGGEPDGDDSDAIVVVEIADLTLQT